MELYPFILKICLFRLLDILQKYCFFRPVRMVEELSFCQWLGEKFLRGLTLVCSFFVWRMINRAPRL